ncbi:hypothetical protein ACWCZ5_16360 [Streptomyces sp. NPDC001667]
MGRIRDAVDRAVIAAVHGGQDEPAGARRATVVAAAAGLAANRHPAVGAVAGGLAAVVVAAESALTECVWPSGEYAGFHRGNERGGAR